MKSKYLFLCLVLCALWGCSDDDVVNSDYTFSTSERPAWAVDWTWNDPVPDWQDPDARQFECSMNMLVELDEDFLPLSSDADQMAIFINGECRGVSYRTVIDEDYVVFLIHVKGTSEESTQRMELRYYCASVSQIFTDVNMPFFFVPNNLMDDAFTVVMTAKTTSAKYPLYTELLVMLPQNTPFTITDNDLMAVFVGDECRGFCVRNDEWYDGWRGVVSSSREGEMAHIRYYSADKGGIFTISDEFELNNDLQMKEVNFSH